MALPVQSSQRASQRASSPLGVALAFLGMFVVGSLGVQLLSTLPRAAAVPSGGPEPVLAHPAALWSALGER
ncbi:hypothetical protein [Cyanobium sp. NIES-981]|uniref:hypothetical protein n=1 Tax=Cyanobium sp. NIES-981 TaxID=1851505 RepID=UPI0007DD83DB|nr:hypothetical protein [Cyanobium sp. NIES-981]SBO44170.1 conserved protein of unknown function [Cyanobium sp. NIES-981]